MTSRERTDLAQRDFLWCINGLSYLQRRHSSLTCCFWLLLLWNPPSSLSLFAPPLSQRRRLHPLCILTPLLFLPLWAASSLRQTAPFMKSVTWADLKRPGDAVSHALTAQVPWDIQECLTFSSFAIPFPPLFLAFFPCLDCKTKPSLCLFLNTASLRTVMEPWIWAPTTVSNVLSCTTNLSRWCDDMSVFWGLFNCTCVCMCVSSSRCSLDVHQLPVFFSDAAGVCWAVMRQCVQELFWAQPRCCCFVMQCLSVPSDRLVNMQVEV